jgi:uncharacterized protein YndB with AHSA1/START domain
MLIKVGVVLFGIVGAFAAFVASRPSEFRIARTRTLAASPDSVYAWVADFKKWPQWSPWEKLDPAMQRELSGAPAGVGAVYHWSGNSQAGEGRMTISDARPGRSLTMRLEFIKPFAATNTAQFDFVPSGQGTNVTWAMTGANHFVAKAVGVFVNMDKMVGGEFEKGLATLDAVTAAGGGPR